MNTHHYVTDFQGSLMAGPRLTRDALEAGEIASIIGRDAPSMRLLTDGERRASMRATLAQRPVGDVWLFAYGSLIWNPAIRAVERRTAAVEGWHRSFSLSVKAGRGSPERPGLVLALEGGGFCLGAAFRIAEVDLDLELDLLWQREMICGAYVPRWVEVLDETGVPFGHAIAFTIDPASVHYAGRLPRAAVVERLATAAGGFGTSADYLFRTRDGLRANGTPDAELEKLASSVEAALIDTRRAA